MSCYMRHLGEILSSAGVILTPDNRKELDGFLHKQVGVPAKHCRETWRRLKEILRGDERDKAKLVLALKSKFRNSFVKR